MQWVQKGWTCIATAKPVGMWVIRTALSVLFTCCPPAPEARYVSILRSSSLTVTSTWSHAGKVGETNSALLSLRNSGRPLGIKQVRRDMRDQNKHPVFNAWCPKQRTLFEVPSIGQLKGAWNRDGGVTQRLNWGNLCLLKSADGRIMSMPVA